MFECALFPNWMVFLCGRTNLWWIRAGRSRRTLCPLLTSLNPPRQSNLINPTNPNKKSHKSKSKLHKSRKMLHAEFLPVRRFCPKNLILGIKAQGQRADRGITLRAVAIKGFDDKRRDRAKRANWSNQEYTWDLITIWPFRRTVLLIKKYLTIVC